MADRWCVFMAFLLINRILLKARLFQNPLSDLCKNCRATEQFSQTDVEDVIHRVQQRLSDQVNVIIETVDEIPRTKAGNLKQLFQT